MGEKTACGKSTQELLLEFQQTGSQAPFEEIARRYAGMVYNVALQVTKDAHDAEDATQATFLTLAVHAKTAGKIRFVGPWLRKVSQRLALDIRRSKKRRTTREQRHALTHASINGNGNGNGHGNGHGPVSRHDLAIANSLQLEELRDILRNELDRLPTKYKMPLILYYFGGLTPEQIGKELNCKTSTLGVRLHRGRKMLADNLSSRGITINSAIAGVMLAALVDTSIRDNLVHACTHAAVRVAGSQFVADATVSAPVMAMVQSVTSTLRLSRLKGLIAAGVLILTTLSGTAAALERWDILHIDTLRKLNPLKLLRPLMERLTRPTFVSLEPTAPAPDMPFSQIAGHGPVATLTGVGWPMTADSSWPAQPQFVTGNAQVGSARLLASQYVPADSLSSVGPIQVSVSAPPAVVPAVTHLAPTYATQQNESAYATTPLAAASNASATAMNATPTVSLAPTVTYNNLVIDRSTGSSAGGDGAPFLITGNMVVHTKKLVVGDSTEGSVIQTNATVHAEESVVIGNRAGSTGTYAMSGQSTLTTPTLIVANVGTGHMLQTGGLVAVKTPEVTGSVIIGNEKGSEGEYVLDGGQLVTDSLIVGRLGVGTLRQSGGNLSFQFAQLGALPGGQGTWTLSDGSVQISDSSDLPKVLPISGRETTTSVIPTSGLPTPTVATPTPTLPIAGNGGSYSGGTPSPMIVVGNGGSGTVILNSNAQPVIHEEEGSRGATILVQPKPGGTGVIRGYGSVLLSGPLSTSGRIIADGLGQPRVLDFSSVSVVTNPIDNPAVGGANGWFTQRGGALKLPKIRVFGPGEYTWGEFVYDTQIDLVNSVRFKLQSQAVGEVDITLLDPLTSVVPTLQANKHAMSLWKLDSTIDIDGIDLMIRYDDAMVSMWRQTESNLGLWSFEDGAWNLLLGETSGIDMSNNLIWAHAGSPEYFAVGLLPDNLASPFTPPPISVLPVTITPEPGSLAGLSLLAGAGLLRRRRR